MPDLCELAARRDPSLERLAGGDAPLEIVACYPRAVKWLFHNAGISFPEDENGDSRIEVLNMREQDAESIAALDAHAEEIQVVRDCNDSFGYVFYVMRRTD